MKKKSYIDPQAEREASKYENPVPSRELILDTLEQSSGPLTLSSVCETFKLINDDDFEAMRRRLIAMERDGQLISNRKGEYGRIDKMDLVRGRVQGHRDGFGFVIPFDGSDDIYLSNRQMRKAFDGDEVLARPGQEYKGKREGSIIEVLVHHTNQLVGRYVSEHGNHYLTPDNSRISQDILLDSNALMDAKNGQLVVAQITQQPGRRGKPLGEIIEVLGDHLAPGMEIDVAIRSHSIPHIWPTEVSKEKEYFSDEVSETDKVNRIDLRHLSFVTIDGEDARDFDDAVYCERKDNGWTLYVAIADVSHYVKVNSALDNEAVVRGNSVYFPDYVIPMLPEVLSNGLCSLNPKVDRLCMVCEIHINEKGGVSSYHFFESVMHSRARLTYTQVGRVIEERNNVTSEIRKELDDVVQDLDELYALYVTLQKARQKRGAIEFESNETRIVFDEQRKIDSIVPTTRNDAHKLIEECMLSANVCAADFLAKHEIPCLYRVHESPKEEKLQLLQEFLREFGFSLPNTTKITPAHMRDILLKIDGRADAHVIQTVMLRSMNQAVYQSENLGHFGLAYDAYAHFTSPIRRYPDLLVHRGIRSVIRSQKKTQLVKRYDDAQLLSRKEIYPYSESDISSLGEQFSSTERRADEATRDVVSWLKCEYLSEHVGDVFDGVVSSVVGFGLFVELSDVYVEGLVHITSLPSDYYHFEAAQHRLIGERNQLAFRLGDIVSVRVVRVSLDDRKIDFELVGKNIDRAAQLSKRKTKKSSGSSSKGMKKTKASKQSKAPKKTDRSVKSKNQVKKTSDKKVKKTTKSSSSKIPVESKATESARKPRKRKANSSKKLDASQKHELSKKTESSKKSSNPLKNIVAKIKNKIKKRK